MEDNSSSSGPKKTAVRFLSGSSRKLWLVVMLNLLSFGIWLIVIVTIIGVVGCLSELSCSADWILGMSL